MVKLEKCLWTVYALCKEQLDTLSNPKKRYVTINCPILTKRVLKFSENMLFSLRILTYKPHFTHLISQLCISNTQMIVTMYVKLDVPLLIPMIRIALDAGSKSCNTYRRGDKINGGDNVIRLCRPLDLVHCFEAVPLS